MLNSQRKPLDPRQELRQELRKLRSNSEESLPVQLILLLIKMCKSNTPVVQEDIGEADESNRMEIGLLNVDSHSNRGIEWTDHLELAIIVILILAGVRVLMKYCKKRNERRLRMMGNTVANMMSAVPPQYSEHTHDLSTRTEDRERSYCSE